MKKQVNKQNFKKENKPNENKKLKCFDWEDKGEKTEKFIVNFSVKNEDKK